MTLHITFHRAASAELIEASTWYETKRVGLALEFIAEIDRCVSLASKTHSSLRLFARTFGVSLLAVSPSAFTFDQKKTASLFLRFFIAAETLRFGRQELEVLDFLTACCQHQLVNNVPRFGETVVCLQFLPQFLPCQEEADSIGIRVPQCGNVARQMRNQQGYLRERKISGTCPKQCR